MVRVTTWPAWRIRNSSSRNSRGSSSISWPARRTCARQQIHLEIADAELGRRHWRAAAAPQQRLDPRQQLGEGERLDQIVVAAGAQALDAVVDRAQRAQDEDRGPHLGRAQGRDHGEPVHARQHAVDDQRVIAAVGRHEQAVAPFGGMIDDIAAFAKTFDDIGGGFAVVLDDENLHHNSHGTRP